MGEELSERELLWRQYELHIDLYKFYLDIALKANVFFYVITGGILTFYFAHSSERLIKYSLLLPIVLSMALGGVFIHGSKLLRVTRKDIMYTRDALGLRVAPDVRVLAGFLQISAIVFFVVTASMVLLMLLK